MQAIFLRPRPPTRRQRPKKDQRSRCMGRSRGGLTTKSHALVDAEGLPIDLKLAEGQAHDGRSADDMLDALAEGRLLLADRAYAATRCARATIKPMPNRKNVPGVQLLSLSIQKSRRALPSTKSGSTGPFPRTITDVPIISSPGSNSIQSTKCRD